MRFLVLLLVFSGASLVQAGEVGDDAFELTAELLEIPSKLPPDDLYDYAYVMKYQARSGPKKEQTLLVAHYKPRQARAKIRGDIKKYVAGGLRRFKEGDVHRLKLSSHLQRIWSGALVDEYFATDRTSARYWCLSVDAAK